MKIKTVLVASLAAGVGYVLGTKAGRARFEQIRAQARDFVESPKVQETVSNLSETVKQSAHKLPDPVANVVSAVADKAKGSAKEPASDAGSTPGAESAFQPGTTTGTESTFDTGTASDTETMYETGTTTGTESSFDTGTTTGTESSFETGAAPGTETPFGTQPTSPAEPKSPQGL